jgi:DNA-binding CsgD family transcriptional regulator/ArsR family metal-binding transcriptional regulator
MVGKSRYGTLVKKLKEMFIHRYFDFSLSKVGVMPSFPRTFWGAYFKLDTDVSPLFPYLNAILANAKFCDRPECVEFILDDFKCMLYPQEVIASPFTGEDQACQFAQRLIDFLNDLYAKKDSLKANYKKFKPVAVLDIYKILPQTNCQECGFATCLAFAAGLSKSQTSPDQCPGLRQPIAQYAVYPVINRDGNLASTLALEIDPPQTMPASKDAPVQTDLSEREVEVLRLVAAGSTNLEISDILCISPHTVKSHVVHILNKLGVNDRTEAAVWAVRHQLA